MFGPDNLNAISSLSKRPNCTAFVGMESINFRDRFDANIIAIASKVRSLFERASILRTVSYNVNPLCSLYFERTLSVYDKVVNYSGKVYSTIQLFSYICQEKNAGD
jgi:hypothetical protein